MNVKFDLTNCFKNYSFLRKISIKTNDRNSILTGLRDNLAL